MIGYFYLVKNYEIYDTSTTVEGCYKISTDLVLLEFKKIVVRLSEFKNNQILLNKIRH